MNISDFIQEKDSQDWYVTLTDDLELFIPGSSEGPDHDKFNEAKAVVENLEFIKSKAICLLESFMKDKGKWWLNGVMFGEEAQKHDCAFTLELGFEANNNKHEYSYTGFIVCFSNPISNPPPLNEPHPFKFIVEFC